MHLVFGDADVQAVEIERGGEFALEKLAEGFAGHTLGEFADEPAVCEAVVSVGGSGNVDGCSRRERLNHVIPVKHSPRVVDQMSNVVHPRFVAHELAHGDALFAVGRKLRPVRCDGFVVVDEAAVDENVDQGRSDTLGRRIRK